MKRKSILAHHSHSADGTVIHAAVRSFKILNINDWKESVQVTYDLWLWWNDPRLRYTDLNSDAYLNTLSTEQKDMIWTPNIAFMPTNQLLTTHQMVTNKYATMAIWKSGNFTMSPKSELVKKQVYRGEQNFVSISCYYTVDFICTFNFAWYYIYDILVLDLDLNAEGQLK